MNCVLIVLESFITEKWVIAATVMETQRMVKDGCMCSKRGILDRDMRCRCTLTQEIGSVQTSVKALTLIRAQ